MEPKLDDIEKIYHTAMEKPAGPDRQDYLNEVCGENSDLRANVEVLLKANEVAGDFLESPILDAGMTLDESPISEGPGTIIGRYKLLEKIGEGGMAVVYMAEQQEPIHRKVALKVIKLGMDTKSVIARFEAERQALAMMNHPNIAKVFDAGATETGRPYFVMELVKGVSITEYSDKNKLNTRERLVLFIQVCDAVQHAHQKGIIHRDIKPSNVMVSHRDGTPVPKIIDFGIAKAINQKLTEKTFFTRYAHIIGTPAYMSPEQAEFSDTDVDTRTDIYSMGVLLYELITGATPFGEERLRQVGYLEMQRIILKEQPTKPSTKLSDLRNTLNEIAQKRRIGPEALKRLIKGDLDWIVMKCLEKDRTRRYDSAGELGAEIQRHINNEPVLAGPPSILYKVRKFIQRRRILVTTSVFVVAALMIGFIISIVMYLRAEHARRQESVARAEAQTIIDFLKNDVLASVYPERAKSQEVTVRYILETAATNLENRFVNSPLAEAAIRETLSLTYQKLGDYQAAESHLLRALQIRREQLGEDDPSTMTILSNLGWLYWYEGCYDDAEPLLIKALENRTRILGEKHPNTLESMMRLGCLYIFRRLEGQPEKAMELHHKVLEIGQHVLGEEHLVILQSMCGLALEYTTVRRLNEAESLATKGLETSRRVLGDEHENTLLLMGTLSWVYGLQARYEEAAELAERALEVSQKVIGEEHITTVFAMSNLGWIYSEQDHYDKAAEPLIKAVEISKRLFGEAHPWTQFFKFRLIPLYQHTGQYEALDELLINSFNDSLHTHGKKDVHTVYFEHHLLKRVGELIWLGKEKYRSGDYKGVLVLYDHLEEIRQILKLEATPMELAFHAMSLYQVGREQEAKNILNNLRQIHEYGEHLYQEDNLCLAEQIFAQNNSNLYQAWSFILAGEFDKALEIVDKLKMLSQDNDSNSVESLQSVMKALARACYVRGIYFKSRHLFVKALNDYETAASIHQAYALPLHGLALLYATCPLDEIRDGTKAVEFATKSCELTSWKNAEYVSTLAAASAETGDFIAAVKCQKTAIDLLPKDKHITQRDEYIGRLNLYESGKPFHQKKSLPMVAWWEFNSVVEGKIIDSSGNDHYGKLIGDAKVEVDPERGNVLRVSGNGYVDCGTNTAFDITGPITVAVWIKVYAFDRGNQVVTTKGDTAWGLQRVLGDNNICFVCQDSIVIGEGWSCLRGTKIVNDTHWHHLVGTYDGKLIRLYTDGELDVSANAMGKINCNDEPLYIGSNSEVPGREWNGWIDDLRIYDYALNEDEIKAIYENSKALKK